MRCAVNHEGAATARICWHFCGMILNIQLVVGCGAPAGAHNRHQPPMAIAIMHPCLKRPAADRGCTAAPPDASMASRSGERVVDRSPPSAMMVRGCSGGDAGRGGRRRWWWWAAPCGTRCCTASRGWTAGGARGACFRRPCCAAGAATSWTCWPSCRCRPRPPPPPPARLCPVGGEPGSAALGLNAFPSQPNTACSKGRSKRNMVLPLMLTRRGA